MMPSLLLRRCLLALALPNLAVALSDGSLNDIMEVTPVITDGAMKQPVSLFSNQPGRNLAATAIEIDLSLDIAFHATVAADFFRTRLLGGSLPGPTLRVRRGDTVFLNFKNNLVEQPGTNTIMNDFSFPDSTNLHFHGAHVSGVRPADDTTLIIDPGESFRYEIAFPEDHMGGIHWIHPHRHGSSTLQVGGGAAMALIVEDEPGEVPPEVEDAEEIILMVQLFDIDTMENKVLPRSGDTLFNLQPAAGIAEEFRLVNGLYNPRLSINAGQWQRWRVVFASWNKNPLDLEMATGGVCEMNLLAKDGIYINDYPRPLDKFPIATGGRADIMVRCSAVGVFIVNDYGQDLFTLDVVEPAVRDPLSVPTIDFAFPRPNYLKTSILTDASPGCDCDTIMDSDQMNGLSYDPEILLHKTPLGSIVERTIMGVSSHPYHQNVYPYQLTEFFGIDDEDAKYYKIGDYHDSLSIRSSDMVKIKYEASDFLGRIAVHCHRFTHSDEGMLAAEIVTDGGVCDCSPIDGTGGFTLPLTTDTPSNSPSATPSAMPSDVPSDIPSAMPSAKPSVAPSDAPSASSRTSKADKKTKKKDKKDKKEKTNKKG